MFLKIEEETEEGKTVLAGGDSHCNPVPFFDELIEPLSFVQLFRKEGQQALSSTLFNPPTPPFSPFEELNIEPPYG